MVFVGQEAGHGLSGSRCRISHKTVTKVSASTKFSSEGLTWEGSASRVCGSSKNTVPCGLLD